MVATNTYIQRWKDTALDLEENSFKQVSDVVIHLYTNQEEEAARFAKSFLTRIKLVIHKIDGWGWPEATLFRYRFFIDTESQLEQQFLLYLDSDMRVVGDIGEVVLSLQKLDGIGVVSHPGFFRPKGIEKLKFYFRSPAFVLRDIKITFQSSSHLGAWEKDSRSTAYVKRSLRTSYAHGAIWFGHRDNLLAMCRTLSTRIQMDLGNDLIARWHDESHLNWFIATSPHKIFDNRLSWVENYKNLENLKSTYLISNVQKDFGEGRAPSSV
jgi:hypothetical protein